MKNRKVLGHMELNVQNRNLFIKIIWLSLAVICFCLFNFRYDPSVLIASGNLILDGHVFDYYEQIEGIIGKAGIYPILCPLIYAVWNIPVRILTGTSFLDVHNMPLVILLWNKIMIVFVYFFIGYELKGIIVKLRGNDTKLDKLWYFMPVPFFITFMMGMYDIWYVFFMVLGLKYYFDWKEEQAKNKYLFLICFGISICFKTLPVFYFIPLLLAREKKIRNMIFDAAVFAVPYILCALPYLGSESFINNCVKFSGNSSGMLMKNTIGNMIPLIVLLLLIYGYAYFKLKSECNFNRNVICVCNYVTCVIFGLGTFHPQWFFMAMPFFMLLIIYTDEEKMDVVYMLHFMLSFVYFILFAAKKEYFDSSQGLLESGLLGELGFNILKRNNYITLDKIYVVRNLGIICSVFLGVMLCIVLFSHEQGKRYVFVLSKIKLSAMLMASLMVFILPAASCYLPVWPQCIYSNVLEYVEQSSAVELNNCIVEKYFSNNSESVLSKIIFRSITWNNQYESEDKLIIRLMQPEALEAVYETQLPLKELPDNDLVELDLPDLKLAEGTCKLDFSLEIMDKSKSFALAKVKTPVQDGNAYLALNGEKVEEEDLQMQIIGRVK